MADKTDDLIISISTDLATVRRQLKQFEGLINQSANNAGKSFQRAGKQMDQAFSATAVQERVNRITGVATKSTKEWTGALASQSKEMEALKAKFNPLYAESKRYESELNELNRAQSLGAINSKEYGAALLSLNQRYTVAAMGAQKYTQVAARGMGTAGLQAQNLAFQFQDIGTMLAAGQSPFILLAQQLPQVTMYGGKLTGVMGALKQTVAGIFSPLGLLTTGFVLAGSAAISYFSDAKDGSDDTKKALKEQADLIQQVADKWGDALPALKAYANEQQRLADNQKANKATQQAVSDAFAKVLPDIKAAELQLANFAATLGAAGAGSQSLQELQSAFANLENGIKSGTARSEDNQRVLNALGNLVKETQIPVIKQFADQWNQLAESIQLAIDKSAAYNRENAGRQSPSPRLAEDASMGALDSMRKSTDRFLEKQREQNSLTEKQLELETEINRVREQAERAGGFLTESQARKLATENIAADVRRSADKKAGKADTKSETDAEKQKKALAEYIDQLKFENTQLGRTTRQQEIYNAVRRAGVGIDSAAGQQISKLVGYHYDLQKAQESAKKAQDDFNNGLEQLETDAVDALGNVIAGTEDAADAFKKLAIEIVKSALTSKGAYSDFFNVLFGRLSGAGGGKSIVDSITTASTSPTTVLPRIATSATSNIGAAAQAIKSIESSGRYNALGPITKSGDRAYGAYQIMGANVGPWSKAALGYSMTPGQMLANPGAQDAIFNHRFGGYMSKYGPEGAAQAWFGGPGSVGKVGRTDILGTSVGRYGQKFTEAMGKATGATSGLTDAAQTSASGLNTLGKGFDQFGSKLASAGSSGGGGSFLESLFGLGKGVSFGSMSAISPKAASFIAGGGIGLFADGGVSNKPAIFGEAGPEAAVPLPDGRRIPVDLNMPTPQRAQPQHQAGPTNINVNVDGANGDQHVIALVRQGVAMGIGQYDKTLTRTFGQKMGNAQARQI